MKDLSIYFNPVNSVSSLKEETIGNCVSVHDEGGFPDVPKNSIVIFDVPEYRNSSVQGKEDMGGFRDKFYNLYLGDGWSKNLIDLGTILPGNEVKDTYYAVSQVVSELIKNECVPVVVGGSQDLTVACYKGFAELEQMVNICSIDAQLDVGDPDGRLSENGYVSHLLMERPCYLFNFSSIGMQRPFVSKTEFQLFERLYFDVCRLGEYTGNYRIAEPYLRYADLVSVDLRSIRSSDLGEPRSNPNGLSAHQVCQMAKYSGISDKVSCFGIFNLDSYTGAAEVVSQLIWYFVDGVEARVGDFPIGSKKEYTKFYVSSDEFEQLTFLKSNKSERWWLEVRYPAGQDGKYERHHLVPCNHSDYEAATNGEIPNLWWRTLQKLI